MWILFSLTAATSQIIRNLYSKKILGELSPITVALSRFIFALPVVLLLYVIIGHAQGYAKIINNSFFIWCCFMGISQILATYFRVSLFKFKSFAVSITIVQVDTIIVAIIGILFLKEYLNFYSWLGILLATTGLVLASLSKNSINWEGIKKALFTKATIIALLTGLFLALAAIFAKKATKTIEAQHMVKSLFTLTFILLYEIIILVPITYKLEPDNLKKIFLRPKRPWIIGICSGIGSFCWITAYSLTNVAYVRVVGQSEFILASLISLYYFKEKLYKVEIIGIFLVSIGTLTLMFLNN